MIAKASWMKHRAKYLKQAGLERFADGEAVLKELAEKLDAQYHTTNTTIRTGANRYLVIHGDHHFTLTTP
jgi:hypothetical protein